MEQENNEIRKELNIKKDKFGNNKAIIKELLSWVLVFAVAFVVAYVVNNYIIINATVPSGSMENTIMTGDRMIGNRLAYIKDGPKRGDIIIFKYPDNESKLFVKRVIGLPGETVEIVNGEVIITNRQDGTDDGVYEEPYLLEEWVNNNDGYKYEIPEDAYFVMGDNRNLSNDARYWTNTYVYRDNILAEAKFVYWPFKDAGKID